MSVIVRVRVNSKSQSSHYSKDEKTGKQNVNTVINMNTVYISDKNDPNFIFSALSEGTKFELATINQDAADQFEFDGVYECVFTKVQ